MGGLQSDAGNLSALMTVVMTPQGYVRLDWAPGVSVTETSAAAAFDSVDRLCAGRPHPLLVNITSCQPPSRAARGVFARKGMSSRIALLGSSPVDRVIANFMLGVFTKPVPTRFFTSEPEAVGWLRADRDD